ncbi:MAG: AAA family ATPase [Acidimicrobiales bacterium]
MRTRRRNVQLRSILGSSCREPLPRLIDEWQREPRIWDAVRREVNTHRSPGQFILTGSATPHDTAMRHSGAGRMVAVAMRPMTLLEQGFPRAVSQSANFSAADGPQQERRHSICRLMPNESLSVAGQH